MNFLPGQANIGFTEQRGRLTKLATDLQPDGAKVFRQVVGWSAEDDPVEEWTPADKMKVEASSPNLHKWGLAYRVCLANTSYLPERRRRLIQCQCNLLSLSGYANAAGITSSISVPAPSWLQILSCPLIFWVRSRMPGSPQCPTRPRCSTS